MKGESSLHARLDDKTLSLASQAPGSLHIFSLLRKLLLEAKWANSRD